MAKLKKEKGITLIALVVTIVILIILSAVVIKSIIDNNLARVATKAGEDYIAAQQSEAQYLAEIDTYIAGIKDKVGSLGEDRNNK